ncbi:MAG: TlpA family protein disulfide reductase [Magnetococcales bacterium]|nr:TlpA family protein disulfide reductase [Magnetococcales bacterium]
MKRALTSLILGLFFSVLSVGSVRAVENPALTMPLTTVAGDHFRLVDFKGQVLVINFWATWCPPCLAEIPELIQFQKEYAAKGVKVIGINFMERPNVERLSEFMKKQGMNYPVVLGEVAEMQKFAREMGGVFGLPITKFLDREGQIVNSHVGGITLEQLINFVQPIMDEQ